ncbi:uncharacterized protein STAUR_7744 [Stigmatella aurantiaca DW4/3-1]|uniref:Uncharacterized protein n=1 Tax=Stigmatella aurantiaca (strain DW4/3-1) TaxID=378806 RepID=E3FKD0_STIAD|nr:uncharacterized protein STAUR_7744 [Stigmatella aurantiaca DW4/3-1]
MVTCSAPIWGTGGVHASLHSCDRVVGPDCMWWGIAPRREPVSHVHGGGDACPGCGTWRGAGGRGGDLPRGSRRVFLQVVQDRGLMSHGFSHVSLVLRPLLPGVRVAGQRARVA